MMSHLLLIGQQPAREPDPKFILIFAALVCAAFVLSMVGVASLFHWYLMAFWNRVPVTITQMIGMCFRGIKPKKVILAAIRARRAGLEVSLDEVENASVTWPLLEAVAKSDYAIRPERREAGKVVLAVENREGRVVRTEGISDIDALARFARSAGFEGVG